jgi:hypothetical protein
MLGDLPSYLQNATGLPVMRDNKEVEPWNKNLLFG